MEVLATYNDKESKMVPIIEAVMARLDGREPINLPANLILFV